MTTDPQTAVLSLGAELTIQRAAEVHTQLRTRLGEAASFAIDLDEVTEIDTAGLQVLLVAARAAEARGGALQLLRPSQPVREAIAFLNLGGRFAPLFAGEEISP